MDENEKSIITPDGDLIEVQGPAKTERSKERRLENQEYTSVIIKRNDESGKHPDDMLENAIIEGQEQMERPVLSLVLSSISAGLILGFAAMAVDFMSMLTLEYDSELLKRLSMALVYPLGFVICILSGSQLFTEHTALAMYPFLDKRSSLSQLVRLWVLVLLGNMVGTLLSAFLIHLAEPVIQISQGYAAVAQHALYFGWSQIFISGVLAGWLMSLGGWLLFASSSATSKIICIYIVIFLIGIGGLHHSIVGSAEVFVAKFLDPSIGLGTIFHFLSAAALGNLFGGSILVAILNFAHIKRTQVV